MEFLRGLNFFSPENKEFKETLISLKDVKTAGILLERAKFMKFLGDKNVSVFQSLFRHHSRVTLELKWGGVDFNSEGQFIFMSKIVGIEATKTQNPRVFFSRPEWVDYLDEVADSEVAMRRMENFLEKRSPYNYLTELAGLQKLNRGEYVPLKKQVELAVKIACLQPNISPGQGEKPVSTRKIF